MNAFKTAALAIAASGAILTAAPAAAVELPIASHSAPSIAGVDDVSQWRDRDRNDRRDRSRWSRARDDRGSRDARRWRGNDGREYCRKSDGTTGLIIGGAAGALLGREIDGGRERTLGTILGAAGGALLGKEIDSGTVCR